MPTGLDAVLARIGAHSAISMTTVLHARQWIAGMDSIQLLALATGVIVASQYALRLIGVLGAAATAAGTVSVVLRMAHLPAPGWASLLLLSAVGIASGWLAWRSPLLTQVSSRVAILAALLALSPQVAVFGHWALVPAVLAALVLPTIGLWWISCTLLVMALGIKHTAAAWYLWTAGALALQAITSGLFGLPTRHRGRIAIGDFMARQPTAWAPLARVRALWIRGWAHVR